jgi:hypothetical protein
MRCVLIYTITLFHQNVKHNYISSFATDFFFLFKAFISISKDDINPQYILQD